MRFPMHFLLLAAAFTMRVKAVPQFGGGKAGLDRAAPASPPSGGAYAPEDCSDGDDHCRAFEAAQTLVAHYQRSEDGLFAAPEGLFWVQANAIETLANWALVAGGLDADRVAPLRVPITRMLQLGFNSTSTTPCYTPACGSYDDQGWWALAWLKAFELTHDGAYLMRSVQIFQYLRNSSWDETNCGGGAYWSKAHTYKNSITNELFFSLAIQLHTQWSAYRADLPAPVPAALFGLPDDYFLRWAHKSWDWITHSSLRASNGLYVDGLLADCSGNGMWANNTFTYNQGVILSGLGKLYEVSTEEALLEAADAIVRAVVTHMSVPGQLTEGTPSTADDEGRVLVEIGCNPMVEHGDGPLGCGENQEMFKGVFMRHLGYLRRTAGIGEQQKQAYAAFSASNSDSAWWHARRTLKTYTQYRRATARHYFANDWRGPYDPALFYKDAATSQIAALALFTSVL